MKCIQLAVYALLAFLSLNPLAHADVGEMRCSWPSVLRQSTGDANSLSSPNELKRRQAQLQEQLAKLESFLARQGAAESMFWRRELLWDSLKHEITRAEQADLPILQGILARYYQPRSGNERPEFLPVRDALRRYIAILILHQSPDPRSYYHRQIAAIDKTLSSQKLNQLSPHDYQILSDKTLWLRDIGRASGLVSCLRDTFSHGNAKFKLSERLANYLAFCRSANTSGASRPSVGLAMRKVRSLISELVEKPLKRRGFGGPLLRFSSTETAAIATLHVVTEANLSAPMPPPRLAREGDIEAAIHESAVNNFLAATLSGVRVEDTELEYYLKLIFEDIPPELKTGVGRDSWYFVFADRDPLFVELRDDGIKVTMRLKEVLWRSVNAEEAPQQVYTGAINTSFGINTGDVMQLRFEEPISGSLRVFIERKLTSLFHETWFMPRRAFVEIPALAEALPPMSLHDVAIVNGWMSFGQLITHNDCRE